MTISVASGKGGTGKTTVAVGLALALEQQVQLLDCDVEEPNSHLFLQLGPESRSSEDFSILVPRIDDDKCTACGLCSSFCEYNALARLKDKLLVFDNLCHGCGGCKIVCPEDAITEVPWPIGKLVSARVPGVDLLYGDLNSGEVLAPPLIRAVKRQIGGSASEGPGGTEASGGPPVIIDSPPGTTCPMVTAVKDSDFSLLVTENTPFGLHDLELAVQVLSDLDMPMGVVINRADIGRSDVEEFCRKKNLPVLMRIPYSREIAEFYARGESIVAADPDFRRHFQEMYSRIEALVAEEGQKP
ncbi:MAG: ATP-binding protein [Spirochaetia bacterium]|nr:ATP-binding protein [Spirochaetia bacterium]